MSKQKHINFDLIKTFLLTAIYISNFCVLCSCVLVYLVWGMLEGANCHLPRITEYYQGKRTQYCHRKLIYGNRSYFLYFGPKSCSNEIYLCVILHINLQYRQLRYLYTSQVLTNQLDNIICSRKRVWFNVSNIHLSYVYHCTQLITLSQRWFNRITGSQKNVCTIVRIYIYIYVCFCIYLYW